MTTEEALDEILEGLAEAPSPGAILEVSSPSREFNYRNATGSFERAGEQVLSPDDGYRIASTSKLFTGTLCMQLAEEGRLDLDTPASSYLDITGAPVADGHHVDEITVWHLLRHTSGFWDFAMSKDWFKHIFVHRDGFFDPKDTLSWAFENGEAVGTPGEKFTYSDTGYVTLGLLLEAVTGKSWSDLCRERILDPLEMSSTWLEGYEEPRSTLSHTYLDEHDGLRIHGSVDWAAGGHVSTTSDLITYIRAMDRGELFQSPATKARWLDGVPADQHGAYGAGVIINEIAGHQTIGHTGFWGSFLFHAPDIDVTVAGTINLVKSRPELLARILEVMS